MALRVLADIALRGLSPAVNDPTPVVQALDEIIAIAPSERAEALQARIERAQPQVAR